MISIGKKFGLRNPRNRGYIIILHIIVFISLSLIVLLGIAQPIISNYGSAQAMLLSKQSFLVTNSAVEEALYRLYNNIPLNPPVTISVSSTTASMNIANTSTGKKVTVTTEYKGFQRVVEIDMAVGEGVSFHYGVQAGAGGFHLYNSSTITGNVFSSGPIIGYNGNKIYGDVVSAGPSGLIYGIHATGTAFAHTLGNPSRATRVDRDAYYAVKTGTVTIGGTAFPNSPDQPMADLPITDAQIAAWQSQPTTTMATARCDNYATSTNICTISSSRTLGYEIIPYNLLVKSANAIITIRGPLWVKGNITAQTGPTFRMDPTLGNLNVAIIADNPTDRAGSGIINIGQSTIFEGSGSSNSFVFLISQNNSAETGGSTDAITLSQGASALIAYAAHGQVSLSQSVNVKEVTAYKIITSQSANVTYDTGLPSVLFSSGPAGGYDLIKWLEI